MTKKLLVVCGAFLAMGLAGCGILNPTDSDSVTINLTAIPDISAGTQQAVAGSVDGSVNIDSIKYTIKDSSGNTVSTSQISVTKNNVPQNEKSLNLTNDLAVKIVVSDSAYNGNYTFSITANAGSASSTKDGTFKVKGGKTPGSTPTGTAIQSFNLNAGANKNSSYGSSIDLDAGLVYKMTDAANHVSDLDLCYAHSGVSETDKLGSPSWATASSFDFAVNWDNPPSIQFYKTTLTADQFNAITTKEEISAKWNEANATAQSYDAAKGDVFIVKTTAGALALVLINDQTTGSTGSITIKEAK